MVEHQLRRAMSKLQAAEVGASGSALTSPSLDATGLTTSGGKTPGDRTPGDKTPDDKTPGDKTPDDKTPDGKTSAEKAPGLPPNEQPEEMTPGRADQLNSLLHSVEASDSTSPQANTAGGTASEAATSEVSASEASASEGIGARASEQARPLGLIEQVVLATLNVVALCGIGLYLWQQASLSGRLIDLDDTQRVAFEQAADLQRTESERTESERTESERTETEAHLRPQQTALSPAVETGRLGIKDRGSRATTQQSTRNLFRVNLNTAGVAELKLLPGIGEVLASRIVQSRQVRGSFRRFHDLLEVRGIGPKKLAAIQPWLLPLAAQSDGKADDAAGRTAEQTNP